MLAGLREPHRRQSLDQTGAFCRLAGTTATASPSILNTGRLRWRWLRRHSLHVRRHRLRRRRHAAGWQRHVRAGAEGVGPYYCRVMIHAAYHSRGLPYVTADLQRGMGQRVTPGVHWGRAAHLAGQRLLCRRGYGLAWPVVAAAAHINPYYYAADNNAPGGLQGVTITNSSASGFRVSWPSLAVRPIVLLLVQVGFAVDASGCNGFRDVMMASVTATNNLNMGTKSSMLDVALNTMRQSCH